MAYSIESIELFVREMPADRMSFGIGKADGSGKAKATKKRRPRAILLTQLTLKADGKGVVIGCSGDRPSFGWLDKRPDKTPEEKLTLLLDLVEEARDIYLECGKSFETAFDLWLEAEAKVKEKAAEMGAEDLMGSYASALLERALIDAVCRSEKCGFSDALEQDLLGIKPNDVHPQLQEEAFPISHVWSPRVSYAVRHTVGLSDPLDEEDWSEEKRINDGEPETLQEYIEAHGLTHFKIKISGDADADLTRLGEIWNRCLAKNDESKITLDGNEAYTDIGAFADFVDRFEKELPGMFDHTLFIEQPLTRALTHDLSTTRTVRRIAQKKPLVIDEADGTTDAFRRAFAIGYSGCSHKNCKGVFKSILNKMLCKVFEESTGREAFLSAEDLSNMAIIPLHQDFEVVSVLNLEHCERNGHHYAFGMSHLTKKEKLRIMKLHPEMYYVRDGEIFLKIEGGMLSYFGSAEGFGSDTQPEWKALTPIVRWREKAGA
jgi:hypothetical protein